MFSFDFSFAKNKNQKISKNDDEKLILFYFLIAISFLKTQKMEPHY